MNPQVIETASGTRLTLIEDGDATKVLATANGTSHVLGTVIFDGQQNLLSPQDSGCLLSAAVLGCVVDLLEGTVDEAFIRVADSDPDA